MDRTTETHDYFMAAFDENYSRMDQYGAIAALTTALEVAAYFYLGDRVRNEPAKGKKKKQSEPPNFNPTTYLGDCCGPLNSGASFRDNLMTNAAFQDCEGNRSHPG